MDDRVALGASFGEEHFGAAQLGDHRRTKRLVQLADKMVMHPGGTLPDKIDDPASLKALYRLVNREEVTHATVLAPSRERTLRLMREVEGTVLVIQDTTELDFSGLASLEGLGAIGNGGCRGYLAHNALAVVAETRDVIGLVYQKLAKRPKVNKKETREQSRQRTDRLLRLWRDASVAIPAAASGRRQVEVADRAPMCWSFWISWSRRASRTWCGRNTIVKLAWKTERKRSCTTTPAVCRPRATKRWKCRRRSSVRRGPPGFRSPGRE